MDGSKKKTRLLLVVTALLLTGAIIFVALLTERRTGGQEASGQAAEQTAAADASGQEAAETAAADASGTGAAEAAGTPASGEVVIGAGPEDHTAEGIAAETAEALPEEASRPVIYVTSEETDAAGRPVAEPPKDGPKFSPHCVDSTEPSRLIASSGIEFNGTRIKDDADFMPWYSFRFGKGEDYHTLPGVITFRGNNWRDAPSFGTASITENTIEPVWKKGTGTLTYNGKLWTGSGWTGQPLLMKWPRDVKQHMNMYDAARENDDLVEVIYACMDGYVYFLDLMTGEATRDPLKLGFTFKGAGALDPRGYPMLYVGAGYDSERGKARVFIINLLDLSVMYTFGNQDPFSLRGSLSYFDASPLVDASSDTLIYPGENGILYLIQLNTQYDPVSGTLSIDPGNIAKWHYNGQRTNRNSYWVGMEDSPVIYGHHLFITDNGGILMCLDLQTLKPVWAQDILDDSNSTPVLSEEDGKLYLYVSTSFHLGWRSSGTAAVPVWKIDAETGEIIWQHDYECSSASGVSGGVQSTIANGKNALSDYIYVTVSKTGGAGNGVLACLDKKTGETVWEHKAPYAWSSPACIYNEDGSGRVFYAVSSGKMYLLDGLTGEQLDKLEIPDGSIEASPAVYEDRVVIGTRGQSIRGLRLK